MQADIIVIGGGPGGYVAAIRGAQLGAKVILIEKDKIGGTCLNYGCIPTKTLFKNAEVMNTLKHASDLGFELEGFSYNVQKIQERKNNVISQLVGGIEQLLAANQVTVIKGTAEFVDAKTLRVYQAVGEETVVSGDKIIIATGSRSYIPNIEGMSLEGVYTSKELLDFDAVPEKLVIIGGGVIGMEFACIFQELGSEVTVVEYANSILPLIDSDITKRFTASLKKRGMTIHTSTKVCKIEEVEGGLSVIAEGKKGEVVIPATAVLVSTGRTPVLEELKLEAVGVKHHQCAIEVDSHLMTNVEGIYAIGDVNGKMMLAHAASHQGLAVIEEIMGIEHKGNHELVPNCIFVLPEISSVGITEDMAVEKGIPYKASKFLFGANGKALSIGEPEGFVKVISDPDDKIIGVHIMGPHASDLIHEGTLAISQGLTANDIGNTIHAHPTLSEAFVEAVMGLKGEAIHMVPPRKRK